MAKKKSKARVAIKERQRRISQGLRFAWRERKLCAEARASADAASDPELREAAYYIILAHLRNTDGCVRVVRKPAKRGSNAKSCPKCGGSWREHGLDSRNRTVCYNKPAKKRKVKR